MVPLVAEFLRLRTTDILKMADTVVGAYTVPYRIFSSILGLYPPDASSRIPLQL